MTLLAEIMEVVVIPLLGILTAYAVRWINAKTNEIAEKRESDLENKYLYMLSETITSCVIATTQTYVSTLKSKGEFTAEAQKEAFNQTYNAVMSILTEDAKEYLTEALGDLELYITQKIEAEVNNNK